MQNHPPRPRRPSRRHDAPPPARDPFDGVLLVDKPSGPTSHDVVAKIRSHFRLRKVGHGGTLDPPATGLLVILIGRGTKMSNQFISSDKTYEGTLCLGQATDSQDAAGRVLETRDCSHVTREALEAAVREFTGDVMQVPPMVSAKKQDGVKLYKLARKGKSVEREPKLIHVYEFEVLEFDSPLASFRLRCTKGTYVRTLCDDIGEKLGCGGHLARLRRARSGNYDVADAIGLQELLELDQAQLLDRLIPLHQVARDQRQDSGTA